MVTKRKVNGCLLGCRESCPKEKNPEDELEEGGFEDPEVKDSAKATKASKDVMDSNMSGDPTVSLS